MTAVLEESETVCAVSDDELVSRYLKGERKAFDELFNRYVKVLYLFVATVLKNHAMIEDIVQETFIKALRALPEYAQRGRFKAWILTIAARTRLDYLKMKHVLSERSSIEQLEREIAGIPEEREDVGDILKLVRPFEREILLLRVVEGLSYDQISEITRVEQSRLRKVVCRALSALRGGIGDEL